MILIYNYFMNLVHLKSVIFSFGIIYIYIYITLKNGFFRYLVLISTYILFNLFQNLQ